MAEDGRSQLAEGEIEPRNRLNLGTPDQIAPWRQRLDSQASRAVDWLADAIVHHWLLGINVAVGVYAFLPFFAPVFLAAGLTGPALWIYEVYSYLCHQEPERSWFILDQQMAFCQRDAAAYPAMFLAGLLYGWRRQVVSPLPFKWFLVLVAPLAIDGLTQAFGLRESTWALRTVTGVLFGVATAWLAYPRFQRAIEESF